MRVLSEGSALEKTEPGTPVDIARWEEPRLCAQVSRGSVSRHQMISGFLVTGFLFGSLDTVDDAGHLWLADFVSSTR